jgi:hypothetical protein
MKLTKCEGLRTRWLARLWMMLLALAAALGQAPTTTTVTGTVYLANGQPGAGTLVVSWPSFTTAAGQLVVADSLTVTIPSDGLVSVNLAPNQGATPAGEYYTAVFYMSDGTTNTQYWLVPAASTATLAAVQAQVMPAAQAVQTVSKAYVDEAIAELSGSEITSSGGTLTGPLYLSGDPSQPLQAADKHYVDAQAAAELPLTGGTLSGPFTATQIGALYQVDQFAGADFGARLQACLAALSTTSGGACDARNFTGTVSMASSVTVATANATVLLPCATIATANQLIVTAGTRNVALRGCALRGGSASSGTQGGTVFAYTGSGAAIRVGDPTYATDTLGFHLDNVAINLTGSSSATAQGFVAYRTQELDVASVYFLGNSNQTGITLDGTGNYTGGTFLDDEFDGFATAVNAIGHQVSNPATTDWMNASTFVRLHIDCPTSSGSPISGTYGINLQQGDGNTFTGGDVENCATALHLGANAQNNTIVGLRNENSTNQVVADAGSSYNNWTTGGTMFTGKLTDNGTRNSFLDTFHRSFNALNGDQYRSQADATVTNHYYLGIGLGNVRGLTDEYTTDVPGSAGSYQNAWQWGPSDGLSGEQVWSLLDMLNNVQRFGVQQNTSAGGSPQSYLNAAGSGLVCFQCSANAGTGGVAFGSGGASPATVATVSNAGNAQFNGTLEVGSTTQSTGTMTVRNNADAEVDYYLWPGLTTSQKGSFTYKDWNGNSQWYMLKDASNNWALNSAVGGLDSFKAYQSSNSGDTYIDASNSTGHIRLNYESGSGAETDIYSNGTLDMKVAGTTTIEFPGLAASSGTNCLQVDNSGYLTNTGSPCGSGGGGGSGTVNSGTTSQIAYYNASGTAVMGNAATVSSAGLGTFSGMSDTTRPVIDTPTINTGYDSSSPATGANGGGGTDECAKLMQLSYNADQSNFTGSIFRSNVSAAGSTIACSVAGMWDPALFAISGGVLNSKQGSTINLSAGTTYELPGELDVPALSTLDGQQIYGYLGGGYGGASSGTFLEPNLSSFPLSTGNYGTPVLNLACPSGTTSSCYGLGAIARNLSVNCNGLPGATGALNASGQQYSYFERVTASHCNIGLDWESLASGGGSQNMGLNTEIQSYSVENTLTPVMTGAVITAGGSSYTSAPTVTVTGCTTAPSYTAALTSGAVSSLVAGPPNYYGASCGTSTAISFSGGGGSGASAVPLVSMLPRSLGMGVNLEGAGAGWGSFVKTDVVAGSNELGMPACYELDEGGIWFHSYCESATDGFRIAYKHTTNLPVIAIGVNNNPANNPGQAAVEISAANQYNGFLGMSLIGVSMPYHLLDDNGNPCTVQRNAMNTQMGVLFIAEDYWGDRISSDPSCVTQVPVGAAMSEGAQSYDFVPVKNVSGKAQPMSTSDTSEPAGIALNGYTGSSYTATLNKMSYVKSGRATPCIFPTTDTINPGDYVVVSSTTVVGSAAGCHDTGSGSAPSSGWTLGRVIYDGTYGSDTIPSTPSAPTLTRSSTGSITYTYETVQATLIDQSESAPTTGVSDTTGPNWIGNGGSETLSGVGGSATAPVKVWRTALGSTLPSGCTVTYAGSQVTGGLSCSSYGAGLNSMFPPLISFSGCTTEPVVDDVIVGDGALLGVHFKSYGNCSSAPTVSWAHATAETGYIGEAVGSSFLDNGLPGDGTTPPAAGELAPRVDVDIRQWVGTTAGVSGLEANGGSAQTGTVNLTGSSVTQPSSGVINISSNVGFNSGLLEFTTPGGATPFLNGNYAQYSAGTSSTPTLISATVSAPLLAKSTAGGTAGEAAGWYFGGAFPYYPGRSPVFQWQFQLPSSADYASGTSTRILMCLTNENGASGDWTTMIASDAYASADSACIRYSNNAGDAEYQLVTCNASACNVVAFPSGATPSTAFCVASLTINSGTSVVGAINCGTAYTATSTTDLPASGTPIAPMFFNTETSTTATHLDLGEIYGYDPGSTL